MKRAISFFSTLLIACVALVSIPQIAHAGTYESRIIGVVGQSVDQSFLSFACWSPEGVQKTYFQAGSLPPGISFNVDNGHITGSYTEAGTYQYSAYTGCQFPLGDSVATQSEEINTTFEVYAEAAPTPGAPTLSVETLEDEDCSLKITGSFPQDQDPGTAKLAISGGGIVNLAILKEQPAETSFEVIYATDDSGFPNADPIKSSSGAYFACNESLEVRLSYRYHGSQESSTGVSVISRFTSLTPYIYNATDPSASCAIYVRGTFPSSGDANSRPIVGVYSKDSEKQVLIYPRISSGAFDIYLPLDDFSQYSEYESGPLVEPGTPPGCGEEWEAVAMYVVNGQSYSSLEVSGASQLICPPGKYATMGGCVAAPVGHYAPTSGMTGAIPCPKGTFQSLSGSTSCEQAQKGFFVSHLGAAAATACPAGKTTLSTGSVTLYDCYALKSQAFTTFKAPTKLKYRASVTVPLVTDNNINLGIALAGRCLSAVTTMKVKVGKTTRTVAALKITAGSEASTCELTLSNPGDDTYKSFTKVHKIKVSKTGK